MNSRILLAIALIFIGWNTNAQWLAVNTGITNLNVIPMATSGSNLYAGTYGGGVFTSTNGGASWTSGTAGMTTLDIFSMTTIGTNIFAGSYGGGVFLSTNNGTSWTAVNNGLTNLSIYAIKANGSNLYAGTLGGGIFLSTNNGTSWTAINNGITNLNVVTIYPSGSDLFIGTTGGGAFKSTNNGASWVAVNTGLTGTTIRSFVASGSNLYAGTAGNGVFLSTNNGASWSSANTGVATSSIWCLTAVGTDIFAGTNGGGVFLSTNSGTTWTAVNTGFPTTADVWSITVSGTDIYAGINGGAGVYKRPLSELVSIPATFSYSSTDYCADAADPVPTISGSTGGVFSSTAGLSINATTGEIDLSASTPGTYTVTYSIGGSSSDEIVTINALDDASFSFSSMDYCSNDPDPIPTISGLIGGIFSSTAGLVLDASSGEIDLSASAPGSYIISYLTNGACPNTENTVIDINTVDNSTTVSGLTITANATGAGYQWLDCDNGMALIAGATNSSFTPTTNGNYAVEVTQNGCSDVSACVAITTIGLAENAFAENFEVYPNPTNGEVAIQFEKIHEKLTVKLYSITGQLIQTNTFSNSDLIELQISESAGVYLLEISNNEGNNALIRLVKK